MDTVKFQALSLDSRNCIKSRVTVVNMRGQKSEETVAMWDTGASVCGITHALYERLGFVPEYKMTARAFDGPKTVDVCMGALMIGKIIMKQVRFMVYDKLDDDVDLVIGLDVILMGDFSLRKLPGSTEVSFSVPPETVDGMTK